MMTGTVSSRGEPLKSWSRRVRSSARRILEGQAPWRNRMTLILGLTVILVAAVGVYALSVGIYSVGYLCFGDARWLDAATYGLMAVLGIGLVLPLGASLYRLACRMAAAETAAGTAADTAAPALPDLFYPFTSLRAYGRCMAVGLEALGWFVLWAGIPLGGYAVLAGQFAYMANRGYHATLCSLLTAAAFLVCLVFGALMLFLSGRRMGYGCFVFSREQDSLREAGRRFKRCRRGFVKPFLLRLSLIGWIAVSVAGVLIPFVVHTIPYALCLSAAYGREMEE